MKYVGLNIPYYMEIILDDFITRKIAQIIITVENEASKCHFQVSNDYHIF